MDLSQCNTLTLFQKHQIMNVVASDLIVFRLLFVRFAVQFEVYLNLYNIHYLNVSYYIQARHTNITDSHIRDRTVSEHTLKGDGSAIGMLDQGDDGLESQEEELTSPVASITTTRVCCFDK